MSFKNNGMKPLKHNSTPLPIIQIKDYKPSLKKKFIIAQEFKVFLIKKYNNSFKMKLIKQKRWRC